jgi:RNA polymerase sigma-70 factor (ECF subfamily)
MIDNDGLATRFEADRVRLQALAFRILGSRTEAEDAVQEAWLRLTRSEADDISNLGGWLTTVVSRVCLDVLRSRKARPEESMEEHTPESLLVPDDSRDGDALLADSVGFALLIVLDKLSPPERVAFVLHDMFDLSFDEIAPIVDRSPAAARQLASRARRRVQGAPEAPDADRERQRSIVEAFLAASKEGNLQALLSVLDPNVALRSDATAVQLGGPAEVRGANQVAATFKGRAQAAQAAWIDGEPGFAVIVDGTLRVVLRFTISDARILEIEAIADAKQLREMELTLGT